MNVNEKAALVIRSLMRQLHIKDHIVFLPSENVIAGSVLEELEAPKLGDGTPDAALAIGEHAFRAGYAACEGASHWGNVDSAWDAYDPPEDIKALS